MPGGRPRKPTKLKILEGNRGHRSLGKPQPEPTRGAPRMPAHLPMAAKRLWQMLAGELDAIGIMTKVDGAALEGLCVAYARAVEADKVLAREGLTVDVKKEIDDGDGRKKLVTVMTYQRPEVAISHNCWRRYKEFCAEFGLTPSARGKLSVGTTGREIDPLEAVLNQPRK